MRQCYLEAHAIPKQRPVSYEDFSMKLDWGPKLYSALWGPGLGNSPSFRGFLAHLIDSRKNLSTILCSAHYRSAPRQSISKSLGGFGLARAMHRSLLKES